MFEFEYASCVYSGIVDSIRYETEYGTKDKTEILQYLVDRYKKEHLLSSKYLQEELDKYKELIKDKF